jgi:aminoglycoside phosphotransferase (APT) family kinase protein
VELAGGRRGFVKQALDETSAEWLRDEQRVYSGARAPFLPELLGWHDDGETLLALEDLGDAHWPPPWRPGEIEAVLRALDALHAIPAPPGVPRLADRAGLQVGWEAVADDPVPLLSTGLCSERWLEHALPRLRESAGGAELAGESLLHVDVRSDNLCVRDGQVLFVDWNQASVGNPLADVVFWLPSLRLEGGPEPWELVPDTGGLAAVIAGFFAARLGRPPPATAPAVREFQLRQAEVALPWAARELGLPPTLVA